MNNTNTTIEKKNHGVGIDAVILSLSKIITSVIGLLTAMLLSRYQTLDEYGTYSQILLIVNLAISIFLLGLPNSINYFLSRCENQEARSNYLSIYYTLNSILCVIMGVALVISEPIITSYFKNPLLKEYVYIFMLLPWTKVTTTSVGHVLIVYGKIKKLSIFNFLCALLALMTIVIVKLYKGSFKEYMLLYIIGEIIIAISVYFIVWRLEKSLRVKYDKSTVKSILTYSIPIGLSGIVGTLMLEADKLIIGHLLNTESIAIYTNAAKELPFSLISTSFTAVLVPQLVKYIKNEQKESAIALWGRTIEICFVFLMFIVTALVVFAPQIVQLLYSEKYIAGINVFRIYSIILLVRITSFGIILNATGKTKYLLHTSIISLIINIFLDYCLYYTLGFIGPAVATLITLILHALTLLFFSSKVIDMSIKTIFPWNKLIKHIVVNLTWGIIVYTLTIVFNIGTTTKDIILCLLLGLFVCLLYFFYEKNKIKVLWNEINGKE